jgi:uncharacterized protein
MKKVHRLIIDTNLWVSFLITKQFLFLDELFESGKVQLVLSPELLSEFIEVIRRPKFKKYFEPADIEQLTDILSQNAEIIEVTSHVVECRDENDNFLLSLAKDGKADYLITGDNDLLVLKMFEKTEIITIEKYKNIVLK